MSQSPQELTDSSYSSLFLTPQDLSGLAMVQDTRNQGPDPNDTWFSALRGQKTGFNCFMGDTESVIWRVVDIRWVFPFETSAQVYLEKNTSRSAEGLPEVKNPPTVGQNCRLFGGITPMPGSTTDTITHYIYLFQIGRVLNKLYVAQGIDAAPGTLTPAIVATIAEKIVARIKTVLPAP